MPYRIDLFAMFIFLGIVQTIFLCFFFFSRANRKIQSNVFYGLMLLSMTLCVIEIFLMYTGYIQNVLHLVDFSEPLSFLIGPFFYFYVLSLIRGKISKRYYWHLAFAVVYFFCVLPFFLEPADVKFNSWVDSFDTGLQPRDYHSERDPRLFLITDFHTELTLMSLCLYSALSLMEIIKVFRLRREAFLKPVNPVLKKLRNGIFQILTIVTIIFVIKILNEEDTGDHLFAAYISIPIYLTSISVINQSGFFRAPSLSEPQKYKSSSVTAEQHQLTLKKLKDIMQNHKPFLKPEFSLPELAQQLGTTVHILSQVINEGLGKNFFEMTAEYRVNEAKRLLKEQPNVKVEEIAEQVGYNSKSSLNTSFKKLTGMTPSEFRGS
jgi:AraC-like DNA-binding protein